MKAKRLPSGSYRVQVYDSTTKKYLSFTEKTEDEAIYQATLWKTKRNRSKSLKLTVGECIDQYIASKTNVLSPSTISGYKRIKKNCFAELERVYLSDLTQQMIQLHVNTLALRLSPKSVRNAHGLLSAVLNVFAPELNVRTTLPQKQKQIKALPPVKDVINAIKGTDIELPCLMALWLGMRMSEIKGAKRSNIKGNILTVRDTVIQVDGELIERRQTKTVESTRQLRLPQCIIDLIEQLPEGQDQLVTMPHSTIRHHFDRVQEDAGLPHICFHDLRHMNASVMLALNIPDKYAMERGGWSSTNIMKSVYQHTFSNEREAADQKIDEFFDALYHT